MLQGRRGAPGPQKIFQRKILTKCLGTQQTIFKALRVLVVDCRGKTRNTLNSNLQLRHIQNTVKHLRLRFFCISS